MVAARRAVQFGITELSPETAAGIARSVASTQRSSLKEVTYAANPSLISSEVDEDALHHEEAPDVGDEDEASDFSYIQVTVDPDNAMAGGDRLLQWIQ
jgi:hypothetical protein